VYCVLYLKVTTVTNTTATTTTAAAAAASLITLPLTTASSASDDTSTATATATTSTTTTNASSSAVGVTRQWANRRRQSRGRSVHPPSNQDVAESISSVAQVQAKYYGEQLTMKRKQHELFLEEHAKRMRVLGLQEQVALQQLHRSEL